MVLVLIYKVIIGDEIFVASTTKSTSEAIKSLKCYILTGKLCNPAIMKKIRDSGIKLEEIKAEPLERIHCFNKNDTSTRIKFWVRELNATLNIKHKVRTLGEYKNEDKEIKDGKIILRFD